MNTKEAIERIKALNDILYKQEIDLIVGILQRGYKFERMFRDVENMYGSSLTWDIEQKYFPKIEGNYDTIPE